MLEFVAHMLPFFAIPFILLAFLEVRIQRVWATNQLDAEAQRIAMRQENQKILDRVLVTGREADLIRDLGELFGINNDALYNDNMKMLKSYRTLVEQQAHMQEVLQRVTAQVKRNRKMQLAGAIRKMMKRPRRKRKYILRLFVRTASRVAVRLISIMRGAKEDGTNANAI